MRVQVFLAEKNIEVHTINIDVMAGETRKAEHLALNSLGEVPVLELDDGTIITESLAICRYFEILHPELPLMGVGAESQAYIEMWTRRMEQQIFGPVSQIGLHEIPYFEHKLEQIPDYAASLRRQFPSRMAWLEKEISDGRPFIAGDNFTIADITGMAAVMVCGFMSIEIPAELEAVNRWAKAVQARTSWPARPD